MPDASSLDASQVQPEITRTAFVSGCFDLLHSGHIAFFEAAARYGDPKMLP